MNSTITRSVSQLQALPWAAIAARSAAGLRACWIAAQLLAMVVAIGAAIAYEHRQQIRDAAIAAIAATYTAGRYARHLWEQLLAFSERMGSWYATLLLGPDLVPAAAAPMALPPAAPAAPLPDYSAMTTRQLRELLGVRKHLSKARLIEMALAA
jgi:hypothetical protein